MITTQDLETKYKQLGNTQHYSDFYNEVKQIAVNLGYSYMQGNTSIEDIATFLRTVGCTWPYDGFSNTSKLISKGVDLAIKQGLAIQQRIQPEQTADTLTVCSKKKKRKV